MESQNDKVLNNLDTSDNVNQDEKVSQSNIVESKKELSQNDKEIIAQVRSLPLTNEEKDNLIATMEMYSGPIPHPKILAGYQALYPDAAKKIIDNGIEESIHRRKLETIKQKRRGRLAWVSMIFLVVFCILFILCSFYLILKGHKIIGSIFSGTSFIIMVGSLLNNINELSDNNELASENKDKNKSD